MIYFQKMVQNFHITVSKKNFLHGFDFFMSVLKRFNTDLINESFYSVRHEQKQR